MVDCNCDVTESTHCAGFLWLTDHVISLHPNRPSAQHVHAECHGQGRHAKHAHEPTDDGNGCHGQGNAQHVHAECHGQGRHAKHTDEPTDDGNGCHGQGNAQHEHAEYHGQGRNAKHAHEPTDDGNGFHGQGNAQHVHAEWHSACTCWAWEACQTCPWTHRWWEWVPWARECPTWTCRLPWAREECQTYRWTHRWWEWMPLARECPTWTCRVPWAREACQCLWDQPDERDRCKWCVWWCHQAGSGVWHYDLYDDLIIIFWGYDSVGDQK